VVQSREWDRRWDDHRRANDGEGGETRLTTSEVSGMCIMGRMARQRKVRSCKQQWDHGERH
jgi:hypothetical protein